MNTKKRSKGLKRKLQEITKASPTLTIEFRRKMTAEDLLLFLEEFTAEVPERIPAKHEYLVSELRTEKILVLTEDDPCPDAEEFHTLLWLPRD